MTSNTSKLDVFIKGELINLCIPDNDFALNSRWYSWFNDKGITAYLEQGMFPNTPQKQLSYFENLTEDRLTLIIVQTDGVAIGVISFSQINLNKKSCDIALVVSGDGDKRLRPYMGLEAMALLTQHGFDTLGMKRISAGQHISLKGWQQRLELIGYKLEGLNQAKSFKGNNLSDSMSICVHRKDYLGIVSKRDGRLWDSLDQMRMRIKKLPKISMADQFLEFFETSRKQYYKNIFDL